jgi:hypothetical protein
MHTDKKEGNWPWLNADKHQPGWTRFETDKTESESASLSVQIHVYLWLTAVSCDDYTRQLSLPRT